MCQNRSVPSETKEFQDGVFIPAEFAREVKRLFAGITRDRRLNTIVERTKEKLVAIVEIAFISIFSRRLKRLAPQAIGA